MVVFFIDLLKEIYYLLVCRLRLLHPRVPENLGHAQPLIGVVLKHTHKQVSKVILHMFIEFIHKLICVILSKSIDILFTTGISERGFTSSHVE
jgi:hypothetical protein